MEESQKFYYKFLKDELIMYLVDTQDHQIVEIPKIYEGLYKHIKGCQLGGLVSLENVINRYNLKWIDFSEL